MGLSVNQSIEMGIPMVEANRPFLLVGPPGCGKTDAAKAIATQTNRKLYLSQPAIDDPVDYKGFAFFQNGSADFHPLGMIRDIMAETEPALWVIDDLGQAVVAVQNAIMQFVHYRNRELNGAKIPDCVSIIACSNGRAHNAGVVGMTDPLKNRFCTIVEVDTSIDSWTDWACKAEIDPLIVAYLHYRPQNLCDFKPNKDFQQSPTPRGWESVHELRKLPLAPDLMQVIISGAVGEYAATEFCAFLDILDTLPDLDAVEADGINTRLPEANDACYAISGALAVRGQDPATLGNVMDYVQRMRSEYRVLWSEMWSQRNPTKLNTALWTSWCLLNKDILAI